MVSKNIFTKIKDRNKSVGSQMSFFQTNSSQEFVIILMPVVNCRDYIAIFLFLLQPDHIALIIELLGKIPRKLVMNGKYSKEFFTKKGTSVDGRSLHE